MILALDTETTGLDIRHGCRPFFVSTCTDSGDREWFEWDVNPRTRSVKVNKREVERIRQLLYKARTLVYHNAKFDISSLESIGIRYDAYLWEKTEDTLMAAHILDSASPHGLKELGIRYLDMDDLDVVELERQTKAALSYIDDKALSWEIAKAQREHWPSMKSNKDGWWVFDTWVPRALAAHLDCFPAHPWYTVLKNYGLRDAERTILLWLLFRDLMERKGFLERYQKRRRLLSRVYQMEGNGMSIIPWKVTELEKKFRDRGEKARAKVFDLSGGAITTLDSPLQMQRLLYNQWGIAPPPGSATKTGYSVNAETVEKILQKTADKRVVEFLTNYQDAKRCFKIDGYRDSYFRAAMKDELGVLRMYPTFNVTGPATTRLSSSNPNGQNIAKKEKYNLREMFGPPPDCVWLSIDYDNIEMRLFAYCSGDESLIAAYEQGKSVHLVFYEVLYPGELARLGEEAVRKTDKYAWTKNGNFALIYGSGQMEADTTYHRRGAYKTIRSMLPKIDEFMENKFAEGTANGYVLTLGGYPLLIPNDEPHKAVNYFIQGTAGEYMEEAIVNCHDYLQYTEGRMIATIHDELLFELPLPAEMETIVGLRRCMEKPGKLFGVHVPASVKLINTDWAHGVSVHGPGDLKHVRTN